MRWALLAAALVLAASTTLAAQASDGPVHPVVLPRTEVRKLRPAANGIEYRLRVALPKGYHESAGSYPVVFVLDADYTFPIARSILEHLAERNDIAPAILVGIGYADPEKYRLDRTRDYTPTHVPTGGYGPGIQAVSGGGPRFLQVIEREIVPYVEETYRASSARFLAGHSYGGLFAVWSALTRPDLFAGYVAVSPSLWYDGGLIFDLERRLAGRNARELSLRMYLAAGEREVNAERDMVADLRRLATKLEDGYPGLQLDWRIEPDETHNSILPGALSDGLRFVLGGR